MSAALDLLRTPCGRLIRPARSEDPARLAPHLRAADLAEIQAGSGDAPETALARGVAHSASCWTFEDSDGALIALYGVGPHALGPEIGVPWMLASDRLAALRRPFLRRCRPWLAALGAPYAMLSNCVDARNALHIRWLGWLGFRFVRRIEAFGAEGRPFYEFVKLCDAEEETGDVQ